MTLDIEFGEVTCASELVNEVRDEREQVRILHRLCVKCLIVLDQSETPILLLDEEHWSCHWGLGGMDPTGCQVLLNEGIQLRLLVRRKRVEDAFALDSSSIA
jgi:hypothetical protein